MSTENEKGQTPTASGSTDAASSASQPAENTVPGFGLLNKPAGQGTAGAGGDSQQRSAAQKNLAERDQRTRTRLEYVPIPAVRSQVIYALDDLGQPRGTDTKPLQFTESGALVHLETQQKRGVVALALLVLEELRRVGATRLAETDVEAITRSLLPSLSAKEMMDVEVEAFEIFKWLGDTLAPERFPNPTETEGMRSNRRDHVSLLQRAIEHQADVRIGYYTGQRGEHSSRVITPHSLEGQKFLKAYCHSRLEERTFKLSRITELEILGDLSTTHIDDRPKELEDVDFFGTRQKKRKSAPRSKPDTKKDDGQKGLFDP